MSETTRNRITERDMLDQIREGMEAYDRDGKKVGRIVSLYMGAEADGRWSGTKPATPAGAQPAPGDATPTTAFMVFGADDDELPEVLRKRLLQNGYIRIDRGLLGRDVYATREQIAAVEGKRVDLNVAATELPSR